MSRSYAKVYGSIWRDDDWRQLTTVEQRMYLLLLSQPEISNCGVIPYVPTRWARMAADTNLRELLELADRLHQARFIVVDEDNAEVLIRTFVKHDKVLEQPKLVKAARRQFHSIQSPLIRQTLADQYPDLFEDIIQENPAQKTIDTLSEGLAKGNGTTIDSARARETVDGRPQTVDGRPQTVTPPSSSSPRESATDDDDEMTTISRADIDAARTATSSSGSTVREDDGPASTLWDELSKLKPTDDQRSVWYTAIHEDPDRVRACWQHAKTRGRRRIALLDTLIRNGSWPEDSRDPDVAPGGKGTRSATRAGSHVCPHCELGFATEAGLVEHTELQHTEIAIAPPPPDAHRLAGRRQPQPPLDDDPPAP